MALPQGKSANLKLIDSKKDSLRNAILLLALQWKDLDEHLVSTGECVEECINEIELREKNLSAIRESVIESNRELDLIRKSIESRVEEFENKEKEFRHFQQMQIEGFELKMKQLSAIRKSADERIEEAVLREERLSEQQKLMEGLLEEYFEGRSKEIVSFQNWIEMRAKELDTKEDQVYEQVIELDSKEMQLDSMRKMNEERCKELELKAREIDSAQTLIEERAEKLDSKEKQLNSVQNFLSQCFKDFHSKNKQLKSDQKLLEERIKELESKEKKIEELTKELELKKKQFDSVLHSHVKVENMDDISAENVGICSSADIQFHITMDGRSLQLFLNERSKDHESMSSEVYRALQLSPDPAKLVLDAMEGFYPPHLKKGDVEFEEDVVRRSCILLLEQLMKISPQIRPHVKQGALKLAGEWKAKMRAVPCNFLEVLGFMQLLASYKLASGFDTDELLELFAVVAEHKQAPKLCRVLGFTEKVPDLIETFVKKKQHVVAVRFVFAFELVDKFPPVSLLKNYLKHSKKVSENICCMAKFSREAQDRAIEERIASIRAVIKCIVDHNLESGYSSKNLEQHVEQLLIQKEGNRRNKPACCINAQAPQHRKNKVMSSATFPVCPNASASMLVPTTPTIACILANMDGMNLQLFLNEHLEEHEWMHKEVSDALQMSFDSGKLVLDAMQGFYPPHSKKGSIDIEASVIRKSCIFLLEILMRLSPQIKPQDKEASKKLAVDWKANIVVETKNQLVILGFLLLVGTYGLASAFDSNELLNLCKTVSKHRYAPELSQALGLSRALDLSQAFGFSEKIPGEVPAPIQFASDPAKLVLDAMQACYYSNLEGEESSKASVMRSFDPLLRKLLIVSLEVKTHVKEDAMKFAADWKAKVVEKNQNPSEVWLFLVFLAIYKLAPSFDMNELFGLLDIVYNRKHAIHLFRALGLADEVPNFIKRLIQRGLHLGAIRYIYTFDLIDEFPPISLLKGYLSHAEETARKICQEGHNSFQAQDEATTKVVDALNGVIKCIQFHGLESQYSPVDLKARIGQLLRQKTNWRHVVPSFASEAQAQEGHQRAAMPFSASESQTIAQDEKKRLSPIHDHALDILPRQHPVKKLCREAISEGVTTNDPIGTSLPPLPTQLPYHHQPNILSAETAAYLTPQPGHSSLGGSTPVPPHMSHLTSQHGSSTPATGGFLLFSSAGSNFGSGPNFVSRPPMLAGAPYSSWSDPNQTGQHYSGTPATTGEFPPFSSAGTHFSSAYNFAPRPFIAEPTPHYYPWRVPNQTGLSDLRR